MKIAEVAVVNISTSDSFPSRLCNAVLDVLRDGRNVRLKLPRGLEAPVARAKLADLRDARWI